MITWPRANRRPARRLRLSERAIPYATLFAKTFGGRLLLVTVWEGADEALIRALPDSEDDLFKKGERYFEKYLADVAKKYLADGVKIDAEVVSGKPVETILKLVEDRHADLLSFATHGRSGLSRWWSGSTAGELAKRAHAPRLIVGPKVLSQPAKAIKVDAVLVPLDGSPLAESALDTGVRIAKQFGAALHRASDRARCRKHSSSICPPSPRSMSSARYRKAARTILRASRKAG